MTTWKEQETLQKALLVILAAMTLVVLILFPIRRGQEGYAYHGQLFVAETVDGTTTYTGKFIDEEAVFAVTPDRVVHYRQGDKEYGPYTITEDPSAYPTEGQLASKLSGTGIEICRADEVIFRGGYSEQAGMFWLFEEDGDMVTVGGAYTIPDRGGEPDLAAVLDLWMGPELTHKGDGMLLFYGLICAAMAVVMILFAEAMFELRMARQVRDPYDVEPSDWELFSRAMGQVILTVAAGIIYIQALTTIA